MIKKVLSFAFLMGLVCCSQSADDSVVQPLGVADASPTAALKAEVCKGPDSFAVQVFSVLAEGPHAAQESSPIERAEQNIVLQWKKDPRLRYDRLSYRGTLKECQAGSFYVKQVLTLRGVWIPIRDLPPETLVFRGERAGFRPGKTTGGAGYFFCDPETGELTAFQKMK